MSERKTALQACEAELFDLQRRYGAARGEATFHSDRSVYLERRMNELTDALWEAVDWMENPEGSPDSNELKDKWLAVLGVVT